MRVEVREALRTAAGRRHEVQLRRTVRFAGKKRQLAGAGDAYFALSHGVAQVQPARSTLERLKPHSRRSAVVGADYQGAVIGHPEGICEIAVQRRGKAPPFPACSGSDEDLIDKAAVAFARVGVRNVRPVGRKRAAVHALCQAVERANGPAFDVQNADAGIIDGSRARPRLMRKGDGLAIRRPRRRRTRAGNQSGRNRPLTRCEPPGRSALRRDEPEMIRARSLAQKVIHVRLE